MDIIINFRFRQLRSIASVGLAVAVLCVAAGSYSINITQLTKAIELAAIPVVEIIPVARAQSFDYSINNPDTRYSDQKFELHYTPDDYPPSVVNHYRKSTSPTPNKNTDIWEEIRNDFQLPELDNKIVKKYEKRYANRVKAFTRILKRAELYLPYVYREVKHRRMPSEIALLPIIESAFNPRAYSHAGAAGLWQFMPLTSKKYGLKSDWWYEGRRDVIDSTQAALSHLQYLNSMFDGDWELALAAYNAGETRIRREIKKNRKRNKPTDYTHLSLSTETRHFVPKLIAVKNLISNPQKFGIELPELTTKSYFESVYFDFQIDLSVLARLADIDENDLARLNPAFRRSITPPDGPHRILVPQNKLRKVLTAKADIKPGHIVSRSVYTVKPGDYLGKIAEEFRISVSAIKSANSLNSDLIRIGEKLVIPNAASIGTYAQLPIGVSRTAIKHIHKVRRGDTLWEIAIKYRVKINNLVKWNEIDRSKYIRPGQKILVYIN